MGKVIPFPARSAEAREPREPKWPLRDYQILAILAQDFPKTPEEAYQEHLTRLAKRLAETKED